MNAELIAIGDHALGPSWLGIVGRKHGAPNADGAKVARTSLRNVTWRNKTLPVIDFWNVTRRQ